MARYTNKPVIVEKKRAAKKQDAVASALEEFSEEYDEIGAAIEAMERSQLVQRKRVEPLLRGVAYLRDL